ncbi:polyketide cyclase [Paenibacillus mesophilus]|uniref:SRPBCC family protein n=1 Tax=Paenibacillus mesophilus TaxID=2582849 RepID=UPI00110D4F8C|nr:SRPBCC family protein [Paenibacillus mesophilus]TMV52283.1 polyketide cyclase [Paenibacillus mesophilus]
MTTLNQIPVVKTEMLIRKPVDIVFEAFIDPAITTKFWFTRSSGRLEAGKRVQWDWEMYGASADVDVLEIEENKRIVIDFGTTVEWTFAPRGENETFVSITTSGFTGDGDDIVKQAMDSTEGFTIVLCGLKALLEHDIVLNLVSDKAPDAHVTR